MIAQKSSSEFPRLFCGCFYMDFMIVGSFDISFVNNKDNAQSTHGTQALSRTL